jgi:hypothetical protein
VQSPDQYPWTAAGYTFDWAPREADSELFEKWGESEFVVTKSSRHPRRGRRAHREVLRHAVRRARSNPRISRKDYWKPRTKAHLPAQLRAL